MIKLDSHDLLSALSLAIDLSECSSHCEEKYYEPTFNINLSQHKFINHSKRTTYVAMSIGKNISNDTSFLKFLFISAALHDIGVTGTADLLDAHLKSEYILRHSEEGSFLIDKLPMDYKISQAIKYHHENYNGTGPFGLKNDEIPLISQVLRISDSFELIYDENIPNYIQRDFISKFFKTHKGIYFNPHLIDILFELQSKEKFWWDVENIGHIPEIYDSIKPEITKTFSMQEIRKIAYVFADIIDKKSPFTYTHSKNLTKIALRIADYLNFDKNKKIRFEIAALMHDVGKLAIPNSILNKEGPLNPKEVLIMKSHTYYTRLILSRIKGFEDITDWASNHHEKLNGHGYPLGLSADKLSMEERIMAVCDIYEALTSDRPYRKGMSNDRAIEILKKMVDLNEVCPIALEYLKKVL
ncbi:Cyclic di-GMP phosphodiesterase response regulator RpfG [Caloramator mitchellensis]|uniref:Cyclic di-GMP phosphodiesterase response regulator RpfG n=1 Tax=Caloramator mitchellensis TaxID=908809 RepID=A0A0R3JVX3_CALMK|nr:HD domain-containing phosphohydrolase [Caloramator mitchellensis]KRQ87705.1 Cyclic di-GMP phosphodiesterase response regulator RpfG [Caloramator mitchellensis]